MYLADCFAASLHFVARLFIVSNKKKNNMSVCGREDKIAILNVSLNSVLFN